jgi:sn-glycerol 3-phosphate transport system permease protein
MEKRVTFSSTTIGLLFALPMLLLIFVFFYWPSAQALYWAFTLEQPWGGGNAWVGFDNFTQLLSDPVYWDSIVRSMIFGFSSTAIAMGWR